VSSGAFVFRLLNFQAVRASLFVLVLFQVADTEVAETPQAGPNWRLVGMMLDRISFLAFSVIYFVLLIVYYLYYL
jgi:hypothetical protein